MHAFPVAGYSKVVCSYLFPSAVVCNQARSVCARNRKFKMNQIIYKVIGFFHVEGEANLRQSWDLTIFSHQFREESIQKTSISLEEIQSIWLLWGTCTTVRAGVREAHACHGSHRFIASPFKRLNKWVDAPWGKCVYGPQWAPCVHRRPRHHMNKRLLKMAVPCASDSCHSISASHRIEQVKCLLPNTLQSTHFAENICFFSTVLCSA